MIRPSGTDDDVLPSLSSFPFRPLREADLRTVGGDAFVAVVVAVVPAVEVAAGGLLLVGFATLPAAVGIAGLLAVFVVVSARQLARGRAVDCGCFGSTGMHRLSWLGVARNLILLAMTLVVVDAPITAFGVDQVVMHHKPTVAATDASALVELVAVLALAMALGRVALKLAKLVMQLEREWPRG